MLIKIDSYKEIEKNEGLLKKLNKDFKKENGVYLILKEENKYEAYICLLKKDGKLYIKDIYVDEKMRFQSFGTRLIDEAQNWARENDYDKVYLETYQESEYFFNRCGFKKYENDIIYLEGVMKDKLRKKEGIKGTIISIIVNLFLAFFKIVFGVIGQSKALVADGFHSVSDVISSIVVLVSINMASKPADKDHPYGHGQLESITGNIIGIILILTALQLIIENGKALFFHKELLVPKAITIYIVIASIIIKYILYIYKIRMGKRLNNQAIIADAKDHKSDVISSIGVLIGIGLSMYVSAYFDIITGIVVALIIANEGWDVVLNSSNAIMDVQEEDFLEEIKAMVIEDSEVYNVHDILMKRAGEKVFLIFHIRIDKDLTIEKGHLIVDRIMDKIKDNYDFIEEIIIHMDPLRV